MKLLVSALGKILVLRIRFVRLVIVLPVRFRRTRSWWIRLGPRLRSRLGSRLGTLLMPSLDFFHSMLLSSHSLNFWTNNTSVESPLPSMGCILGLKISYLPVRFVLVLVLPTAFGSVTGLGILGLLAVLTAFARFEVLGFLARSLAVVTPLTTSVIASGLEVSTVGLARGVRLGFGPRTLG